MIEAIILSSLLSLSPHQVDELGCMVEALYYEARNDTQEGMSAVASVIINRVQHPKFHHTICGVIRDEGSFSYYSDGKPEDFQFDGVVDRRAFNVVVGVALTAVNGALVDRTGGSLYYHTVDGKRPKWASSNGVTIGKHVFYK